MKLDGIIQRLAEQEFPQGYNLRPFSIVREGTPAELGVVQQSKIAGDAVAVVYRRSVQVFSTTKNANLTDTPSLVIESDRYQEPNSSALLLTAVESQAHYSYVDSDGITIHQGPLKHSCSIAVTNSVVRYIVHLIIIEGKV